MKVQKLIIGGKDIPDLGDLMEFFPPDPDGLYWELNFEGGVSIISTSSDVTLIIEKGEEVTKEKEGDKVTRIKRKGDGEQ
jgi:hypothetical protein